MVRCLTFLACFLISSVSFGNDLKWDKETRARQGKHTYYSDDEWFIQLENADGTKIWSGAYLDRFVRQLEEGQQVKVTHADRYSWTVAPYSGESEREFSYDEVLEVAPLSMESE